MKKSFTDFKNDFYSRVKDFSLFDAGDFNMLKVVLDGLKVNYSSKGKIRVVIFNSPFFVSIYFFLLRMKKGLKRDEKKCLTKNKNSKYLIIDAGGRIAKTEKGVESFYFSNIIKTLKRENVFIALDGNKTILPEHDLHVPVYNLELIAVFGRLDKSEKNQLGKIKEVFHNIQKSGIFTAEELSDIKVAFQQFFILYRFWYRTLKYLSPEKVFLLPHYHREGCIYALKEKKIKIIELQHGLISPADIFYVLPESVKKIQDTALFADEIWVYGDFWKKQLLKGAGYSEKQVRVVGYFPFINGAESSESEKIKSQFPGKKMLLITTQTYMQKYFIDIAKFFSSDIALKNLPWFVVVKIHPAENQATYSELNMLSNVIVTSENLDSLFRIASAHLSVFSTTLYDAMRYSIPNYSVRIEEYGDYIDLIKEDGIAEMIGLYENPLIEKPKMHQSHTAEFYFAKPDYSLFQ